MPDVDLDGWWFRAKDLLRGTYQDLFVDDDSG
jgi:hypothetical protein